MSALKEWHVSWYRDSFVILTIRFVPYTVRFEVPDQYKHEYAPKVEESGNHQNDSSVGTIPIPSSSSSILPSLSSSTSAPHTPLCRSPQTSDANSVSNKGNDQDFKTAEEFFYNHHKMKGANSSNSLLSSSLTEKYQGRYIQPKSRVNKMKLQATIIEPKNKNDEGVGSPSLRINRSLNNLSSLSSISSPKPGSRLERPRTSFNKQNTGFTLHANNSTTSIDESFPGSSATSFQNESNAWKEEDFNELSDSRAAKLAPFGGFSNPDIEGHLYNQESIFETAPWEVIFSNNGNVSLTKAVRTSVKAGVIHKRKWVGTLAMPSDVVPDHVIDDIAASLSEEYNSEVVFPSDIVFQGHYKSFCKQILWPTLHYQIPDDPKSKAFEDHSWGYYKQLNQLVANKIVEVYEKENSDVDPNDPENMIWIHDYHLLLVPQMVREKLPNAKIGLFLHVSFPSSEVFRCLAQRSDILKGMLGANCISFQTQEYVRHFLQTCSRILLADTSDTGLTHNDSFILTNTIPVGIDEKSLSELVKSEEVDEWRQLIRERFHNSKIILSRDKIDKLRGIKQKLLAYEKFLKTNPEMVEDVVLIQICIGNSDDPEYEAEIMKIVGRINSLPENISDIPPVVLLKKDVEFDQYVALQSEADLFIVSSQREGMNLTCHEYITATHEKKSPLLLSEFTGSAPYLECNGKGAILINPWDVKKFSDCIKSLLSMSEEEKLIRWENQFHVVQTLDSKSWVMNCLKSINESWLRDQSRSTTKLKPLNQIEFEKAFSKSTGKRLIFVNLESPSTVVDLKDRNTNVSDKSLVSEPTRFVNYINRLLDNPQNHVYIITFLTRSDLDILYKRFPKIGLIAENGGYIKLVGSSKWLSIVDEKEIQSWMPQVIRLIQSKVERLPGSYCEVGDCTVRFHPGSSLTDAKERAMDAMGDCIQHINLLFQESDGVHSALVRNVVVVQKHQLALKALKFLISFYDKKKHGIETEYLIKQYNLTKISEHKLSVLDVTKKIDEMLSRSADNDAIGFVLFCGGTTPLDEPSYEYLNELEAKEEIKQVLTVAIIPMKSESRTSATFSVGSKNELLTILSNSTKP